MVADLAPGGFFELLVRRGGGKAFQGRAGDVGNAVGVMSPVEKVGEAGSPAVVYLTDLVFRLSSAKLDQTKVLRKSQSHLTDLVTSDPSGYHDRPQRAL